VSLLVATAPGTILNVLVLMSSWHLFRTTLEPIHMFIFGMTSGDLLMTGGGEYDKLDW
jgi:hypothetical protein